LGHYKKGENMNGKASKRIRKELLNTYGKEGITKMKLQATYPEHGTARNPYRQKLKEYKRGYRVTKGEDYLD
jgi:hypothetical protein